MIEAAIFDMDGVVIDSLEVSYRARAKVLQDYGVNLDTVPDPHEEQHKGASMPDLLLAVKQHTGVELRDAELSPKIRHAIFSDLEKSNVSVDPDLLRLLGHLQSHKVPLAICT